MKYRQWKKNYKKRYGVNPPPEIDKRKRRKQVARALNALAYADLIKAAEKATDTITNVIAEFMRALGRGCDTAGTVFRNAADAIKPLDIKGRIFSWEVRSYGTDLYAVYEINALGGADELRALTHSKSAAEKIAELLENDQIEHFKATCPERVVKKRRWHRRFGLCGYSCEYRGGENVQRNAEKWIYGELTGEDKEIFGKIEEALGFRLFVWQKSFLLTGCFRRMGATTAECLRDLLFKGMEPLDFYRYPPNSKRERIEREELRKIKEKLDAAGIKTRPIFWNESDRARYYREQGAPGRCESPDCKNCPFPPCEKGGRRI